MKKLFTIGLMMLFASSAFSQATHTIDFEPAGVGADWAWTVSENGTNPDLEFVANPDASGINTSATVAKLTATAAGQAWALCFTSGDGEFTFDNTNSTVKIMVHKPVLSDVGFKVEGMGQNTELKVPNTVTGQWEELTFDFSALEGQSFNKLVIIPDFAARTTDNIIYFDNIQVPDGVEVAPVPGPTTAAPTPIQTESNVISIYSDAYTDVEGTNFNPGWGQSTSVSYETVEGNNVLSYSGLDYQGTEYTTQNVSDYDFLHVDFWTPNSTALSIFLISSGTGTEVEYVLPITTEDWVSVDIDLTDFAPVDLTIVDQFKVVGNGSVWFDNLYFWGNISTSLSTTQADNLKIFPNPVEDVLNIKGLADGEMIEIYSNSGSLIKKSSIEGGSVSVEDLPQGIYFIKIGNTTQTMFKK
jgi:hypothetical protein